MKLNDFWPKEDQLSGRLTWEDEAKRVLYRDEGKENKLR